MGKIEYHPLTYPEKVLDEQKDVLVRLQATTRTGRSTFLSADDARGKTTLMNALISNGQGVCINILTCFPHTTKRTMDILEQGIDNGCGKLIACIDELDTICDYSWLTEPIANFVTQRGEITWVFALHPENLEHEEIIKFRDKVDGELISF